MSDLASRPACMANSTAPSSRSSPIPRSAALAAFAGTQLSYWSRINLDAAIGYFGGVTGTLDTANGDHITTDVTIASGGVIDVTGRFTVDGALGVLAGGALGFTLGDLAPMTKVGGATDLEGALDLTLASGFDLVVRRHLRPGPGDWRTDRRHLGTLFRRQGLRGPRRRNIRLLV